MQNHTTAKTREVLIRDVDKLKKDALQIAQDVKAHANAHVDQTKQRVLGTVGYVRENVFNHPEALLAIGFVGGFLLALRLRR